MSKSWILQTKETRRTFETATWIPLRSSLSEEQGKVTDMSHSSEFFGCGSVAFPPEHLSLAEKLSWSDIGLSSTEPYAYKDGYYASIFEYQYNDKQPIGLRLVLDMPVPIIGGKKWVINPDLIAALRLIKEGNNWVRPEENFDIVIREKLDDNGEHTEIEIKKEYLQDYLAARNLSLKITYYRQRVENIPSLSNSSYAGLESHSEDRDGGRYELRINDIESIFGGGFAFFRTWRTDIDEDEDAPKMGPETNDNTDFERSSGYRGGFEGIRVEGEFWRDEWISHNNISKRIRGDFDDSLPQFIVDTDGSRLASSELNSEDVGRWLWFRSSIINEVIALRGFSFQWYTAETGGITSTSGYSIHFGLNLSDLITVYAYDIAKLPAWEQHIWAAKNVIPDGKISAELFEAQVKAKPASTQAVEVIFFEVMEMLDKYFQDTYKTSLFSTEIDRNEYSKQILRFESKDEPSILRLAKDLIRAFSDRINVSGLREISTHSNKNKLGSNKLLESILAEKIGSEKAREIFGPIAGTYDMRLGDSHPTSSSIQDAFKLAEIDENQSYLRQGKKLISNFAQAIWYIGKNLSETKDK